MSLVRTDAPPSKPAPGPWVDRANCMGLDPDLFFPEKGHPSVNQEAIEVCRRCVVRAECLEYAQTSPVEIVGVWGGLTPRQRQAVRCDR